MEFNCHHLARGMYLSDSKNGYNILHFSVSKHDDYGKGSENNNFRDIVISSIMIL